MFLGRSLARTPGYSGNQIATPIAITDWADSAKAILAKLLGGPAMTVAEKFETADSRFFGRPVLPIAILLIACAMCIIGGFAAGAYMQFGRTVFFEQDKLMRDILVAKICAKSGCDQSMRWLREDVPVALYNFESDDKLLHGPLLGRLFLVSISTWVTRNHSDASYSPDRFRQDILTCNCGLELDEEFSAAK